MIGAWSIVDEPDGVPTGAAGLAVGFVFGVGYYFGLMRAPHQFYTGYSGGDPHRFRTVCCGDGPPDLGAFLKSRIGTGNRPRSLTARPGASTLVRMTPRRATIAFLALVALPLPFAPAVGQERATGSPDAPTSAVVVSRVVDGAVVRDR